MAAEDDLEYGATGAEGGIAAEEEVDSVKDESDASVDMSTNAFHDA